MKPYFDAGLKHLALAAGYPVASIQACDQFKRTHYFLLEVWEAVYRAMISIFVEQGPTTNNPLKVILKRSLLTKKISMLTCSFRAKL